MKTTRRNSLHFFIIIFSLELLTACASTPDSAPESSQNQANNDETIREMAQATVQDTVVNTGKSIPGAAQAPLRDLNISRMEIPKILADIDYPYALDEPVSCDVLIEEINALNDVLGLSEDIEEPDASQSEQATKTASNATQSALEGAATGWLPYRSVIRFISGATAHERALRRAYDAGLVRRGFLKGIGSASACPFPARPLSLIEPQILPDDLSPDPAN